MSDIVSSLYPSLNTILVQVQKAESHLDWCISVCMADVKKKSFYADFRSGLGWLGGVMWEENKLMNGFTVN